MIVLSLRAFLALTFPKRGLPWLTKLARQPVHSSVPVHSISKRGSEFGASPFDNSLFVFLLASSSLFHYATTK